MKKTLLVALSVLFISFVAVGQELLVADGSSSGTYKEFLKQITVATSDSGIVFKEVESHGAIENLDKLINNEVMAAFMHSDVLFHRAKAEAGLDKKFQTLLALFPEDVHFVALSTSKKKVGGTLGYGAKPVVYRDISDLANGGVVGAAGGGWITANVVKLMGDVSYQILPAFTSGKEVLAALDAGTIDAAVFVGASPLPNLKDLGPQYKLLPITGITADKLKTVYKPTTITYTKMSPNGVPTVSAQCVFVSKVYKSPKMVNTLASFRNAFFQNLDLIKETPGNHKSWQTVNEEDRGLWPWLELPTNVVSRAAQ